MMDWLILVVVVVGLLWGIWGRSEILRGLQEIGDCCFRIESKLDKVIELLTADPQPGELLEDKDANP